MKRLESIKTIELFVFILLSLLCFYLIIVRSSVYHQIAESRELQLVCILLWLSLFSAFTFVFLDFSLYSKQKSDFNALDYAVHSDSLAKIANRQGIDDLIEQYVDKPLPPNMGCAMFLLTSLNEINQQSRIEGNTQIRNFSVILKLASTDICFVGRNGGNVFMAIFENTTKEEINTFMTRIEDKVIEYNKSKENFPMYFQFGIAYRENPPAANINALISLANKRAHSSGTLPAGIEKKIDQSPKLYALPSEDVELNNAKYIESKVYDLPEGIPTFVTVVNHENNKVETKQEEATTKSVALQEKTNVTNKEPLPSQSESKKITENSEHKYNKYTETIEPEVVTEEEASVIIKVPKNHKEDYIKDDVVTLGECDYRYSNVEKFGKRSENYKEYYREVI